MMQALVDMGPMALGDAEGIYFPLTGGTQPPPNFAMWRLPCAPAFGTRGIPGGSIPYRGVVHAFLLCRTPVSGLSFYSFSLRAKFIGNEGSAGTSPSSLPDINCTNNPLPASSVTLASFTSVNYEMWSGANLPQAGSVQQCDPAYFAWNTGNTVAPNVFRFEVTE
jgi:hypothetical protein